jgi:CDP-diacylglycerol---serine O-phosphatidyltransferase
MKMPRVSILASLCTLANALCGFGAITLVAKGLEVSTGVEHYATYQRDVVLAGYLVILAMGFDALDGRLARFARATSDFGGQLDSLSDAVSFGLAPAFIMNRVVVERLLDACPEAAQKVVWAAWICGAVYLGCALIRLARFNVENVHEEEAHRSFKGLPSPAAAGALVSLIIVAMACFDVTPDAGSTVMMPSICTTVFLWAAPIFAVVLGLLMVSRVRYLHLLNVFIRGRRPIGHLVFVVLMIALTVLLWTVLHEAVLLVGFGIYALSGPVLGLWRLIFGRKPSNQQNLFSPPSGPAVLVLMAALGLACGAAGGCVEASSRLWADTALTEGGMSSQAHQWAYDGETVTFELECPPDAAQYVVFGISGDEEVVEIPQSAGRYRWTHTFKAGLTKKDYEVYARPYLVRGHRDYIFDSLENKWLFYPSRSDKPDVPTAAEKTMTITCYRIEMRIAFAARGGPPQKVSLSLVRSDGHRTVIPQRASSAAEGAAGFAILGPDARGVYEVVYVPRAGEVSRAEITRAELAVRHADGSESAQTQDYKTP